MGERLTITQCQRRQVAPASSTTDSGKQALHSNKNPTLPCVPGEVLRQMTTNSNTNRRQAHMSDFDSFEVQARLKMLEQALAQSQFREASANRPLVYGYLRSATYQPLYIEACRRALERYCGKEKLLLCGVFTDYGVAADRVVRPGFTGLCDVLRLPDSFAAVIVKAEHLATDARITKLLAEQVRATGARLLFVRSRGSTAELSSTDTSPMPGSGTYAGLPEWWQ